ncbi:MAG TPA: NADH-quinone oxidoreductase subunit J [Acidobacteriaceae bacterium]|nr:NADH-quinone oxidoreductase subunit J [Acidobacteriaceae bacterium]
MSVPFLILAAITIAAAVAAMTLRKLVHCALALAVCLVGLAGLYLDLGAEFVGLAQVLVYVGAVVILIVFAILLTRSDEHQSHGSSRILSGVAVSACVFGVLAWAVVTSGTKESPNAMLPQGAMKQIGVALMQRYVLPLEIVGLLLTAALIGAVVIAMEEKQNTK